MDILGERDAVGLRDAVGIPPSEPYSRQGTHKPEGASGLDLNLSILVSRGLGRSPDRLAAGCAIGARRASVVDEPFLVPGKYPDRAAVAHLEPSLEAASLTADGAGVMLSDIRELVNRHGRGCSQRPAPRHSSAMWWFVKAAGDGELRRRKVSQYEHWLKARLRKLKQRS